MDFNPTELLYPSIPYTVTTVGLVVGLVGLEKGMEVFMNLLELLRLLLKGDQGVAVDDGKTDQPPAIGCQMPTTPQQRMLPCDKAKSCEKARRP